MKLSIITAGLLGLLCAHQAMAYSGTMALRYEPIGVQLNGGVAHQTIEDSFGTQSVGLAFTGGTQTYDFYSAPLAVAVSVANNDKAGGIIYMTNSAPTSANDFTVSSSMTFYDYNPLTGIDSFIILARQTSTAAQNVNHSQIAYWHVLQSPAQTNYTLAPGHQLHVVLSVNLQSGNPGSFAQLVYNGPNGASTVVWFPRNAPLPLQQGYTGSVVATPTSALSIAAQPDGTAHLTGTCGASGYYLIQATTNLNDPTSWVTLSTNLTDLDDQFEFTDTNAPNYSWRFYRASTP